MSMLLEDYFDFVAPDVIRFKGRRIGLEHIVELYHAGLTAEQIAAHFGDLDLERVYAAITYYLHNRVEVDASLARLAATVAEQRREAEANPSPVIERLRQLKRERQQEQMRAQERPAS
jgi:uncharacterized protein (DUF433 family)